MERGEAKKTVKNLDRGKFLPTPCPPDAKGFGRISATDVMRSRGFQKTAK
jgi:hypothetical protein